MVTHALLRSHKLPDALSPTAAAFARDASILLMGTESGAVLLLEGGTLREVVRFKHSRVRIECVAICAKCSHVAAATADGHVLLFFLVRRGGVRSGDSADEEVGVEGLKVGGLHAWRGVGARGGVAAGGCGQRRV